MNRRILPALCAVVGALLLWADTAAAKQSQRPLPGTYTLGDGPVPSVCVEEGVSLELEPTVYASVGESLRVRRVPAHGGEAEELSLQAAIDRGMLVCRSRKDGQLGLVFEKTEPGEYVLTVPPDAPGVVARSADVRGRIEPLVSHALPRVPDGLSAKGLRNAADEINRDAMALRGPQREQWDQLRNAGLQQLKALSEGAFKLRESGERVRLADGELLIPENALFRDLLAAIEIVQALKGDPALAAAAAKWPALDAQRVGELRRLKHHQVAEAVVKGDDPGAVWLRRDGLPDVQPDATLASDPNALPKEWVALLNQGDLVVDLTGLSAELDAVRRETVPAAAAALRRRVPGAKVLLAHGPGWRQNVERMWAGGPNPVGVVVQPDDMGRGLGAINAEIVKMFTGFPKLDRDGRFGAVVTPPGKPQAWTEYAEEVRTSKTLGGVPVEGRQWLLVACRTAAETSPPDLDALANALEAAGASQVVTTRAPMNGLAASVAISELFARLESADANPVELWTEWTAAQREARRGLAEIQLPPELPASATDLLKHALEQLDEPDAKSSPSASVGPAGNVMVASSFAAAM